MSQEDVPIRPAGLKVALRRKEMAWMFVLQPQMWMTFRYLGDEVDAAESSSIKVTDIRCCFRSPPARPLRPASWEILPGPLFWNLQRNTNDIEFQVGQILSVISSSISIKVVGIRETDWRGRAMARVRVVDGGWSEGKWFSVGSMFLATLLPLNQRIEEIVAAHRSISGMLGSPWHVVRLEGILSTTSGPRLLLREDFGLTMPAFFNDGGSVSAEDADRCASDLLIGLSAIHGAGLHHLTLSSDNVLLMRDGLGRLRLKIANLGVSEQPSEPLPRNYMPPRHLLAPEIGDAWRFSALSRFAAKAKTSAERQIPDSKLLFAEKGGIQPLPGPKRNAAAHDADPSHIRALLEELPYFSRLPPSKLRALSQSFDGPYSIASGRKLFKQGDVGDFLYMVLAGEVVTRRGSQEICRYGRGDVLGEAALLGKQPSERLFSAASHHGPANGGCVVIRLDHKAFQKDLTSGGPLTSLAAPARWRYLKEANAPFAELKAADVFAAGALWCELVTGMRPGPVARLQKAQTIDQLRAAVAENVFGGYYFTLEERRVVALVTLLIRRATPKEALHCLQDTSEASPEEKPPADSGSGSEEEPEPERRGPRTLNNLMAMVSQGVEAARSSVSLGDAAEVASDALTVSARAGVGIMEQWEQGVNVATERYGRLMGTILGDIYGQLFAKDFWWMFREPLRTPKYPVVLVTDAEDGSLPARWLIGTSLVFERQLRQRTLPQVAPSIRPAFTAGFEIGAAIGRNRAINFKRLWLDAFLGSFVSLIKARLRIILSRVRGSSVSWDDLGAMLTDAVKRGRAARRTVLLRFGRLPTTLDEEAPRVLKLLPSKWVPDIGLPLAAGIGRRFFPELLQSWRRARRKRYVRPKFETWDVDDVPAALRDFAEEQGAQQAGLVASAVGDTIGRGAGFWMGSATGALWAVVAMAIGHEPTAGSEKLADGEQQMVAGGYLEDREELLELERYLD